ncbi:hypothetical protein PPERSA_09903 [Pseudocohnilembus persalinus]|uniref:TFIIB-type domain-containing protein n=1 Tax=Pseudocohnilembus persalinus TaxID=266149 RepID=A0A0V0QTP1_PSEPJ|nr:hypothetical protein PPERSA_09903 [Pseudocohnilembus persalinus]|eukprot:KRX05763.1 hypothetical protein PPERSA_09903 [Pseudocohnilembus persalinus]
MLDINQQKLYKVLKCPNNCQPNTLRGNNIIDNGKYICQSCGLTLKNDQLETEKMYKKSTQNYQEMTEKEVRVKKILQNVRNFGQTYDQLNRNEIMEIEKDIEMYVQHYNCQNMKALIGAAYYRFCEIYKSQNIVFGGSNSVLTNKKQFLEKFSIKYNNFKKYYQRLKNLNLARDSNKKNNSQQQQSLSRKTDDLFLQTQNTNFGQNHQDDFLEIVDEDEDQDFNSDSFQFPRFGLQKKLNQNKNQNQNQNLNINQNQSQNSDQDQTFQSQQNQFQSLKQENGNDFNSDFSGKYLNSQNGVQNGDSLIKSNKEKVQNNFVKNVEFLYQKMYQNYLKEKYFYFFDNFSNPFMNMNQNNLMRNQNQNQNLSNNNIKNTSLNFNSKASNLEQKFRQSFLDIMKSLFLNEGIIILRQGKFTQNIIISLGYVVFSALNIQLPKKTYAKITSISYSTLVRETKDIESCLIQELEEIYVSQNDSNQNLNLSLNQNLPFQHIQLNNGNLINLQKLEDQTSSDSDFTSNITSKIEDNYQQSAFQNSSSQSETLG